jgi:hypothetical protein
MLIYTLLLIYVHSVWVGRYHGETRFLCWNAVLCPLDLWQACRILQLTRTTAQS